ncbi:ThiF family adenylyltransferase [Maridesulfovibrio sp.]|uniref:HesA/MoeB/ThiF family protein n=1 Tax=Maridesulfovibrio sp. TaxID=2795000 RepID=UPI002A18C162|nr:ThiF family adenylyltransferase [Maridesulfovibrio sp.]
MRVEDRVSEMMSGGFVEKEYGKKIIKIAPHELCRDISRKLGMDRRFVEQIAFDKGAVPERYARNMTTFSPEEQKILFESEVAIVGLGGLGGHLLESLVRAGVGRIMGCDGDFFEPSNLNRQRLASENTLGIKKGEAAFDMVREINPSVFFDVRSEFIEGEDFDSFISGSQVVVDCLGGLAHRTELKEACSRNGIPMVTASVAGWAGIVSTVLPGGISPADFFGNADGLEEVSGTQAPAIFTAVGIQSGEVLKILLGRESGLSGKALMFDLAGFYFELVSF